MAFEAPDGAEIEGLLTVRDVAEFLHVHPATVRRLITRGEIPFLRIGRSVRLSRSDLELWMAAARRGRPLDDLRAAASP